MAAIVREAKADPLLRERVLSIISHVPEKEFYEEICTILEWVQNNIRYVRDVNGVETVQTPQKTLQYMRGDCDDQSVLLATFLEILGNQTRFRAVGPFPGFFTHVFVQVEYGPLWVSLDPIVRRPVGWQPPGMTAAMVEAI